MKKFLLKLITVILTVAMITGTMASCGLFTVNTDRDVERAVATVDIDGEATDVAPENIYKREMVAGFMSYGYMYVQSYGYSLSDTYSLILDNLINNKIIIQYAKKDLVKKYNSYASVADSDKVITAIADYSKTALALFASEADVEKYESGKNVPAFGTAEYLNGLADSMIATYKGKAVGINDALFRFLDADTVLKIYSEAIDGANSIVDSFIESEDSHEHETFSYTVRTTPTMDDEEEEDFDLSQIKTVDVSDKERKTALAEAKDRFVELGLINSKEEYKLNIDTNTDRHVTDNSILNLTYFKLSIAGSLESEIITKYEEALREEHSLKATVAADQDTLWNSYVALAKAQEEEYKGNVSGMETALGAVSDSSFVTYNADGYGYVSHFLIQFGDDLKAELEDALEEAKKATVDHEGNPKTAGTLSTAHKDALIAEYAQKIVANDLRATWVQAGYGTLEGDQTVKFTDSYVYTDVLDTYLGTYERVDAHEEEDADGNKIIHYNYFGVKPDDISFADFNDIVNTVMNTTVEFGKVGQVAYDENLKERFEDLKFAFSSDEGNFNSYLGYLYSPVTSSTQYVSAFAAAAEEVVDKGAGAYKMFGSYEYGLHIVLCTKKVSELVYDVETDKQVFIDALDDEDSVAYNFLEATNALLESNIISKLANTYVQEGLGKEGVVVRYEKAYEDLIEESAN